MKKTLILTIAALMTLSVSSHYVFAADVNETSSFTQSYKASRKKAEIKEVIFSVHLHCENCVKKVQENIAFEKGVKDLKISLEDQTVAIKYDAAKTSEEVLKAAIVKLGYPVNGKVEKELGLDREKVTVDAHHHQIRTH